MKLTDDIVKAFHICISEGYESVADFAKQANVSAETITKYMRKETQFIKDETWSQLQPLLMPYMKKKPVSLGSKYIELETNQRILLDAFGDLPEDVQEKKLLEIVALAREYIGKKGNPTPEN